MAEMERRISQLEVVQAQTIEALKSTTKTNQIIMAVAGGFFAVVVGAQSVLQGLSTVRHWRLEEGRDGRQALREGERDKTDLDSVERMSNVMTVVQRTLESRLDAEELERKRATAAEAELQEVREKVETVERFLIGFQAVIKNMRQGIEKRASEWAKTVSRHDFRGMANELNRFAEQFDMFKDRFEPIEDEPRTPFTARVPYIRGIAAHYANEPQIAKDYLEDVVRSQQLEHDEILLHHNRRAANAYYYLGLTECNFGNEQDSIELFEKANGLDLQYRDFLTRVVTAEAYVMTKKFERARDLIGEVKGRLVEIEKEGPLHNYHLRLRSRAALIEANMAILGRGEGWLAETQRVLEPVYEAEPQYYYATATLAQVYHAQGDRDKAQELFGEAYRDIEHSGDLITVTETRSKILLLMVAGMCCKHGLTNEKWSEHHLDGADDLRGRLPKMDSQICTVFSTLSKKNENSETIHDHIAEIRKGVVLLDR